MRRLGRISQALSAAGLTVLLAACTHRSHQVAPLPVGTGWARAPDLSVYSAMRTAGQIAREQDILCWRSNPAEVDALWRAQFSEREAWIANALATRYGAEALEEHGPMRVGRERCPTFREDRWHRQHARLLRMLELRLYPKDYWSAG